MQEQTIDKDKANVQEENKSEKEKQSQHEQIYIESEMLQFLQSLFHKIVYQTSLILLCIIIYASYLCLILQQYEQKERLIRCVVTYFICQVFLRYKCTNSLTFSIIIYSLYIINTIVAVESCLRLSPISKQILMSNMVMFQNVLHKLSLMDKNQKVLIQIAAQIYFYIRCQYYYSDDPEMLKNQDYITTIIGFVIFQYMNLDIDQNFIQFITLRFQKAKETEKLWLQTIKKMPNGIILFDLDKKQIIFENHQIQKILSNEEGDQNINADTFNMFDQQSEQGQNRFLYDSIIQKQMTEEEKQLMLKQQMEQNQNKQAKTFSKIKQIKNFDQSTSFKEVIQEQIINLQSQKDKGPIQNSQDEEDKKEEDNISYKVLSNKNIINIHTNLFEGINSSLVLISVTDITYLQKFEKKRLADRFINLFFQSIAHDIRTPLNTIMMMCENLMMQYENEKMIQSSMKLSQFSCQFLLMFLDQIRELSSLQLKKIILEFQSFDFRQILQTLFENSIIQAELKSLKVNINIDQRLPKIIYSDQQKFYNIMFNILTNAIKYTNQGQIQIFITQIKNKDLFQEQEILKSSLLDENESIYEIENEIQFVVEDTGPGLSKEQQEYLFQLFGKAKFSDDKLQTGLGVGLTYCKQVIEQLQGNIMCVSEEGKGAKFIYTLKVKSKEGDNGLSQKEQNQQTQQFEQFRKNAKNILRIISGNNDEDESEQQQIQEAFIQNQSNQIIQNKQLSRPKRRNFSNISIEDVQSHIEDKKQQNKQIILDQGMIIEENKCLNTISAHFKDSLNKQVSYFQISSQSEQIENCNIETLNNEPYDFQKQQIFQQQLEQYIQKQCSKGLFKK